MTTSLCLLAAFALTGCAGCSEECSGKNVGSETCPCSSDQDCATADGSVLLCQEGSCKLADPPDALDGLASCELDADCEAGSACGADGYCVPAPRCQRIEVELQFRVDPDSTGSVTSTSVNGCTHGWTIPGGNGIEGFSIEPTIDLDGNMDFGADNTCASGHWYAGDRIGELDCDSGLFAIGPDDVIAKACVGACPPACRRLSELVGVCP